MTLTEWLAEQEKLCLRESAVAHALEIDPSEAICALWQAIPIIEYLYKQYHGDTRIIADRTIDSMLNGEPKKRRKK